MTIARRILEAVTAGAALIILSPLFGVIALLILHEDGGPVFFRQERVGLGGRRFRIWKFRTMTADAGSRGGELTVGNDPRITRIGHSLRKWKLDELPQLINVVTGEMGFVGPRPETPKYVALYSEELRHVLSLRPGITDPASIAYSRESDILAGAHDPEAYYISEVMPSKVRMNLDYADDATLWSDIRIVLRTILHLTDHRDRPLRANVDPSRTSRG